MQHADPDQLALVALGEPLEDGAVEVTGHLRQCAQRRQEVDALRRTVDLARETVDFRTEDPGPPEGVWSRIAAELDLPATPAAGPGGADDLGRRRQDVGPGARPGGPPLPRAADGPNSGEGWADDGSGWSTGPGSEAAAGAGARQSGGRRKPAGRHAAGARPWTRTAAALVAAAAVGVVGTLVAVRPWQDDAAPPTVAGSAASLAPVAGGPGSVSGRAVVVQGATGPQLDVTTAGLPAQQGYYEVWVFDGDKSMVSVGVLGANSTAELALPPTLDLRRFHVVDISQEQYDGNQNHSTVSVLRGTLTD